jgi:uncharacterized membrane protein
MKKINSFSAGYGILWYKEGWELFKKNLGIWLLLTLAFFGIHFVLNFIPVLGGLITSLLTPGLMGAFYLTAHEREQGGEIDLQTLLTPFKDTAKRNAFLTLGAINIIFILLTILIFAISIGGAGGISALSGGSPEGIARMAAGAGIFAVFLMIIFASAITMAMIYAVPLIMFTEIMPIDAMKLSIQTCFANFLPLLVFGLIYIGLMILSVITFFIGFIFVFPISVCAVYASFKDIFLNQ